MNKINLYLINIDTVKKNLGAVCAAVGEKAVSKAERYIKESDKLLSLGASFLLKRYVGGEISVDEYGKPRADGVFFSISHSHGLSGLAVTHGGDVGLDIEKNGEDDGFPIEFCLSDSEMKENEKTGFLPLFVAKESLSKAEGRGLYGDIKNIPALPPDGETEYLGKKYFRHSAEYYGYFISVTCAGEDFSIITEEIYDVG